MSPAELKTLCPNAMTVVLSLPPKELSPNSRCHWRAKAEAISGYRYAAKLAGWEALQSTTARPLLKEAAIQAEWFTRTAMRPDADNALASLKAAFDGLTDAGLFANDKGLTHLPIRFAKDAKNPRVVLTITPHFDNEKTL